MLAPLKPGNIPKPFDGEGNIALSGTQMKHLLLEDEEAYALVVVEKSQSEGNVLHPLVQPLLRDFVDIILEELPPGLPPIRDIQHCIDLVPGVVLPYKAAY